MPLPYDDFLSGVESANWLGLGRGRARRLRIGTFEDGTVVNAVAKASIWSPARIAGVIVGVTVSAGAVGMGSALFAGVVVLTAAAVSTEVRHPPPPPPPPSPPHVPPTPLAPPGSVVTSLSQCVMMLNGVPVDYSNNGRCEDGGSGSVDALCPLGTDAPDCHTRYAYDPPLPPIPPPNATFAECKDWCANDDDPCSRVGCASCASCAEPPAPPTTPPSPPKPPPPPLPNEPWYERFT